MTLALRYLLLSAIGLCLAFATLVAMPGAHYAQAEEDTNEESVDSAVDRLQKMRALIQDLLAQVQQLQERLKMARGEVRDLRQQIRQDIREGMEGDDIRRIQEILASDRSIYPEGIVSGYFGPLTGRAISRFQARHDLEVTGEMDDETRAAFETLLEERFGAGQVPPGLLNAPGIKKKFEQRLKLGCDNSGPGKAPFCLKMKQKFKWDDDDEDEDDDEDDSDEDDREDAEEAIADAQAVIDALEDAIDDAEDGDDKDDASDSLDDSNAKLDLAEEALDDGDYEEAEELADEAEDMAEDAYEALTGEEFEDEDDDDEDDEDDEDDDEDDEDDDEDDEDDDDDS